LHDAPFVLVLRFRSCRVATFWVSDRSGSVVRLVSGSRSRAILPALSFARRHSSEDPGELGRLLSRGVQRVALELRHAWERPGGDPGPSTDVCSSRMLFSKTIAPRLGARRIIGFPRDARARGFTPQCPLRRAVRSRSKHCPLRSRLVRRTSDTPSPRASPAELCPPVSARDRSRDLRSKTRGLGPLHQAA
jgi:hypothetical protein